MPLSRSNALRPEPRADGMGGDRGGLVLGGQLKCASGGGGIRHGEVGDAHGQLSHMGARGAERGLARSPMRCRGAGPCGGAQRVGVTCAERCVLTAAVQRGTPAPSPSELRRRGTPR
ncbi:hypothetical protein ACFPRL_28675 [Pseudoclavibacter helvolus]